VEVDRSQLEPVIVNLAVNARDAMRGGGVLTVATSEITVDDDAGPAPGLPSGSCVQIAVTDTGTGMDEATQARAFAPFFTTKGTAAGTGLGLATVYGIVRQSRGGITLESEPGRGTTFRIALPSVTGRPPAVAAPVPVSPRAASGATVLVVDDEPAIRWFVGRSLRLEGYDVLECSGGAEAAACSTAARGRSTCSCPISRCPV
jgi:two-component system cell cycle sensor histidine kinase/response regulator CckA